MAFTQDKLNWRDIMDRGFLVKLSCTWFRSQMRLVPDEIKVPSKVASDKEFQRRFALGSKKIAPPEYLLEIAKIANRAQALVREHAMDSPFGHFVRKDVWPQLALLLADLEVQFWSANQTWWSDWEAHREQTMETFRGLFDEWGVPVLEAEVLLSKIDQRYPSLDSAKLMTRWSVQVFSFAPPSAADVNVSPVAEVVAEQVKKQAEATIESFAQQFRRMISEWAVQVLGTLQGREKITHKKAKAIRAAVERFRLVDALGDDVAQQALNDVEAAIGHRAEFKPNTGKAAPSEADEEAFAAEVAKVMQRCREVCEQDLIQSVGEQERIDRVSQRAAGVTVDEVIVTFDPERFEKLQALVTQQRNEDAVRFGARDIPAPLFADQDDAAADRMAKAAERADENEDEHDDGALEDIHAADDDAPVAPPKRNPFSGIPAESQAQREDRLRKQRAVRRTVKQSMSKAKRAKRAKGE